jgi:hypothetical protein
MATNNTEPGGILSQFQRLEELIIEHTRAPTTIILRNQLNLVREQIEAYQASSDRQDKTLAAQLETVTALQKQIASKPADDFVKHRGALFKVNPKGGYEFSVYCRECKEPMVCVANGLPFRCSPCHVTVDFTRSDLNRIIKELP